MELRQRDVGELLGLTLTICRERFGDLAKAVAIVMIPASIFSAVLIGLLAPPGDADLRPSAVETGESLGAEDQEPFSGIEGAELTGSFVGLVLGVGLGASAAQLSTAAVFRIVAGEYVGLRQPWYESVSFAFARFWPLIWLQVLSGLLLFVGFLLLFIPGIYLAVAWTLAVPILLFEHERGWRALSRSRELIRDRWWPALGLIVVLSLLSSIVGAALTPLLVAVFPANGDLAEAASQGVASGLVAVLTGPLIAAGIIALYFDARVRKDDLDVREIHRFLNVGELPKPW